MSMLPTGVTLLADTHTAPTHPSIYYWLAFPSILHLSNVPHVSAAKSYLHPWPREPTAGLSEPNFRVTWLAHVVSLPTADG